MRGRRLVRRLGAGSLLTAAFVLLLAGSAFAATFHNQVPTSGVPLANSSVTFSIGATATAGQNILAAPNPTFAQSAMRIDGGPPFLVGGDYVYTLVWDDGAYDFIRENDTTQANFSYATTLDPAYSHTVSITVTETPSNTPFTYTWSIPAQQSATTDCTDCHSGYPDDHSPTTMADCTACHTSSNSPVYAHSGLHGTASPTSCDGHLCHLPSPMTHDGSYLGEHIRYDLEGNPSLEPATPCETCHPDAENSHGNMSGAKFFYKDLFDAQPKNEGGYASCSTCHAPGANKNPHGGYDTTTNKCKVCHAVHRAEGAYYLLRADSQDDACNYCHIGESAHSLKVVYDLNPAGTDTTNGHTIGAACSVPDSSVRQYATSVVLSGVDCDGNPVTETIQVRAYDTAKLSMYRFGRHHGQSDEGTGRGGYAKIGPLNLRCMSCHQTHNAIDEVWRPYNFQPWSVFMHSTATQGAFRSSGYKLLKRYPSGTTTGAPNAEGYYNPGQQVKAIEGNAVKEGTSGVWGTETANFSSEYSAKFVYAENGETAAAPMWIAQEIQAPPSTLAPGTGVYRYPYFNNQYALSYWCADCHNLNIGGWKQLTDAELGFKAHTERTHPAPFVGSYDGPAQCYTCHRNDLAPQMGLTAASNPNTDSAGNQHATPSASVHSVCSQCHYGTLDYSYERASSITYQPSDFPHSGKPTDIKLLGSYTTTFIDNNGNWSATYQAATITEGNLDAVCLRCHPGVGVHQ